MHLDVFVYCVGLISSAMAHGVSDQDFYGELISSLYGQCIFYYYFNPQVISKSEFIMHYVIRPVSMSVHLGFCSCHGKD